MDNNSLSHTKYKYKYHIVFVPKFRRREIYGEQKAEIGKILRQLCEWKGVNIMVDQISFRCIKTLPLYRD